MHILIYFLFHNQNVARVFPIVIVWHHQFDCDVVCIVTVWRSWNFLLLLFRIKDTECSWTNVSNKILYFIVIGYSFKGRYAVFFMLDEWMTFLICTVMKQFIEFISFLWKRILNVGKVLLCAKIAYSGY
jgi:hypothetical protein